MQFLGIIHNDDDDDDIYIFLQMATLATYFGLGQQTHRYFWIPSWNYITHSCFEFSLFEH